MKFTSSKGAVRATGRFTAHADADTDADADADANANANADTDTDAAVRPVTGRPRAVSPR
ncbi:hypothetical protein [Burkholderia stagnalis]|uniref:hypothetical protein n=1 Tax=Burkholderia stagnalis TaxID=1503054 RepID=UPI0012D9A83D|nr:hypothetical protein [Burkholderia stagnalis]